MSISKPLLTMASHFTVINHDELWSTTISHYQQSSTTNNHHQPLCTMISHYEPRKTMIICLLPYEALPATSNDYQPPRTTTTITNHDERLPTIIDHYQPHSNHYLKATVTTMNHHWSPWTTAFLFQAMTPHDPSFAFLVAAYRLAGLSLVHLSWEAESYSSHPEKWDKGKMILKQFTLRKNTSHQKHTFPS